jgi:hypothetical protein
MSLTAKQQCHVEIVNTARSPASDSDRKHLHPAGNEPGRAQPRDADHPSKYQTQFQCRPAPPLSKPLGFSQRFVDIFWRGLTPISKLVS